eukprot:946223-Amphidinium_carterae.3
MSCWSGYYVRTLLLRAVLSGCPDAMPLRVLVAQALYAWPPTAQNGLIRCCGLFFDFHPNLSCLELGQLLLFRMFT